MGELAAGALLDGDLGEAVAQAPVDGGRGERHIEGHAIVMGGQRLQICADLIGDIAGGGGAVGADDAEIDHAMLHEMAADIVGDDGMGDAVVLQLPGGERGALVARPRLVDPDMDRQAALEGEIDRRRGGAPIHGREPAGIAMGQDLDRLALAPCRRGLDQRQPGLADGPVDRHILLGDRRRLAIGQRRALGRPAVAQGVLHAVQRPAQIDRGGPCRGQQLMGRLHRRVARIGAGRQRHAIGGGRPDQRRAAHLHVADGAGGVVDIAQGQGLEGMGQARLVDDADGPAVGLDPDGAMGNAADLHIA